MLVGENTYSELFYAVLILQMYTTWVLPDLSDPFTFICSVIK